MARSKLCTMKDCSRPADKASPEGRLCIPCLTEAEWENTHSDNAHDEITKGAEGTFEGQTDSLGYSIEACWICHPELNEASATYKPRKGVSRKGQFMSVPPRASGPAKAAILQTKLAELGWTSTISTRKGITVCQIKTANFRIEWDANGNYQYGPSVFGAKKLRNVSEAIRTMAGREST